MISIIGKKQVFLHTQKTGKSLFKRLEKFEQNNKSIAINVLYVSYNTEEIRPACKSKYNFKHENQVILLMITDGKKWHYLTVKSVSALFRGIT